MKLYLHLIRKDKKDGKIETYVYHLDNQELITIEDFEKKVFLGLSKVHLFLNFHVLNIPKHPVFSTIDICTRMESIFP